MTPIAPLGISIPTKTLPTCKLISNVLLQNRKVSPLFNTILSYAGPLGPDAASTVIVVIPAGPCGPVGPVEPFDPFIPLNSHKNTH